MTKDENVNPIKGKRPAQKQALPRGIKQGSKIFCMVCFWLWLASAVLPDILAEYWLLGLVLQAGQYVGWAMMALAVVAFVIALLPAKKAAAACPSAPPSKLIIHDLDPELARQLWNDAPNTKIFCAGKKMVSCRGLFDCWLTTPGVCVLHDGTHALGSEIATCDELILVSKSLYGGFGKEVKNALDRSISFALPFFKVCNKEQHHQERHKKVGKMRVYIHHTAPLSEEEKASIWEVAKANSINMNKKEPVVRFVHDMAALQEVLA